MSISIVGKETPKTTKELKEKYPLIFSKPCEISIHDGWVPLLDTMCHLIQRKKDLNEHMGYTQVVALQVKEKYGGLRFYYNCEKQVHLSEHTKWSDWTSWVDGVISMTEEMALERCEKCGEPGKMRNSHGYYYTACDKHLL